MINRPDPRSVVATTVVVVVAALAFTSVPSAGQDEADEESAAPSVEEATSALAAAEAEHADLDDSLTELTAQRDEIREDLDRRDDRRRRAARDLIRARTGAQSLAILAYMTADDGTIFLGTGADTEVLYRETLLRDGADARVQAAAYYQDLQDQADAAVATTVDRLADLDAQIDTLSADRDIALDEIRAAGIDLETARAAEEQARLEAEREEAARAEAARAEAERQEAAELAQLPPPPAPSGSAPSGPAPAGDGPWTPIGTIPGGPTPQQWAQLRGCESGGNYRAVSPGGAYRGAYQFDLGTWRTVGGSGDPIAASPAEQDHRAQLLWQSRGHAPWPVCGRYLI